MPILHDFPNEDYHSSKGISNSGLTLLAKSPFHYYANALDPNRPPREDKPGQLEGTLAHCAALEPDQFDRRYKVGPDVSRATKEWKEEFARAERQGLLLIKPDQYQAAMRQGESIRNLPQLEGMFERGDPEVSAWWDDPRTGVTCRCRPDWVHRVDDKSVVLLDVKTFSDASPEAFAQQIARKRYYVQAAFYTDGFELASGLKVLDFIFVAVESNWPHAANALGLDEDALQQGRREYRRYLDIYARCLRSNVWPAYGGDAAGTVSLPRWRLERETAEEAFDDA